MKSTSTSLQNLVTIRSGDWTQHYKMGRKKHTLNFNVLSCLSQMSSQGDRNNCNVSQANRMSKYRVLCIQPEGADDVKKQQLMELAIINGTYREPQQQHSRHPTSSATTASSQHSSPSPLSPSLTFDDLESELYPCGQLKHASCLLSLLVSSA